MNRIQCFLQAARCGRQIAVAATCLAATVLPARAETPPDVKALARRGAETIKRLASEPVSWTATHDSGPGFADVKLTRFGDKRRISMSTREGAQEVAPVEIIIRDGAWYVTEKGESAKYRPFEAPLGLPTLYSYLSRSEPVAASRELLENGQFDRQEDGVAYFLLPLSDALRGPVQSMLDRLQEFQAANPDIPESADVLEKIRAAERMLSKGLPVGIDPSNGIVVSGGIQGQRVWIKDFEFSEQGDESVFAVEAGSWRDETGPIGDPNDLAIFGHCGAWKPDMPKPDLMAVLVNLRDGRSRRVPYENGIALGGSFSLKRDKVFVTGQAGDGLMAISEIDLRSGKNRRVAAESLRGTVIAPSVSPDGTKLIVSKRPFKKDVLSVQLTLIDLPSDKAAPLAEPFDMNMPDWLPDGSGIITERRVYQSLDKPALSTICRIDIKDGARTDIRPGSSPVVLRRSKRILFEEAKGDDDVWKTCDLDGSNVRLVGDGLGEFSFAAPSPTGEQVIMMKFGGPNGPRPHLVDPLTGKAKPIPVGPGLWAFPAWR